MKEQVQVDNNDEQKQGEIIGELMEDVKQKISNTDKLTGGDWSYKEMERKEKERREKKWSDKSDLKWAGSFYRQPETSFER